MSKITFLQLAQKVLSESAAPMSVEEIWAIALKKGYTMNLSSSGKTPSATMGAQLYVSVKQGADSPVATVGHRPKRFYLKSQAEELDLSTDAVQKPVKEEKRSCCSLYFLVVDLLCRPPFSLFFSGSLRQRLLLFWCVQCAYLRPGTLLERSSSARRRRRRD